MSSTGSEQQGQNVRVRPVFLTLTKILDLFVFFHQMCKNKRYCIEEKQFRLKISLVHVLDRATALTGVSRASAQRILNKKVEQPIPSIEDDI